MLALTGKAAHAGGSRPPAHGRARCAMPPPLEICTHSLAYGVCIPEAAGVRSLRAARERLPSWRESRARGELAELRVHGASCRLTSALVTPYC